MTEVTLPNIWSDWEITRLIGAGSYGSVYEAVNRETGQKEAVKVISVPKEDNDVDTMRRTLGSADSVRSYYLNLVMEFNHEIRNLERLKDCENIVDITDSYIQENKESIGWKIFIRMELLSGTSERLLQQTGNESEVIKMGIEICNALEKCEAESIMHRDIKPENILVSDEGKYVLCDFGVAKNMEKTLATNSVQGTFSYMAPEVYNGKKYGSQADLYSLGIILYQCVNKGRLPFIDVDKKIFYFKDKEEALVKRMTGEPMPAPVNASEGLAEIVLKACEYSPEDRYKTASELKADLLKLQKGRYRLKKRKGQKKRFEITITRKQARRIAASALAVLLFVSGAALGPKMVNHFISNTFVLDGIEYSLNKNGVLTISATNSEDSEGISWDEYYSGDGKAVTLDLYDNNRENFTEVSKYNDYALEQPIINSNEIKVVNIGPGVTEIAPGWFRNCDNLKQVNIKGDVEVIREHAFYNCYNLEEINLPDSLRCIGNSAFYGCENLKSIELPAGLEEIGENAFCGCKGLTSIVIPDRLTEIKYGTFYSCESLKSVKLQEGLEKIGDFAFMACENLEEINLPESVTSIGEEPFRQCSSLNLPVQNSTFIVRGEVADGKAIIPEGVTEIGSFAFAETEDLKAVEIPASVKKIGDGAFYGCKGLSAVEIPDSLESIGASAFSDCTSLKDVKLPASLDGADQSTFSGCDIKETLVINGQTVLIKGQVKNGRAVIPENVDIIGEYAFFENDKLKELVIPDSVKYVGAGAFNGCENLESAEIAGSVKSIEDSTFIGCVSLKKVKLGNGVKSIGPSAFSSCTSLESVNLPEGITSIGDRAFSECIRLKDLTIPASVKTIEGNPFIVCEELGEVYYRNILYHGIAKGNKAHIPADTKLIAKDAFSGNAEITEAVIPPGLVTIDESAFFGCTSLKTVVLPESVKMIGEYAFEGTAVETVKVSIATYIGKNAFPETAKLVW